MHGGWLCENVISDWAVLVLFTPGPTQMYVQQQQQEQQQQHRQGREHLLRAERRARQVLEVARAADAQATMLRRACNQRATLQLL